MSQSHEELITEAPRDQYRRQRFPITRVLCDQCGRPLYITQLSPTIEPSRVSHLKELGRNDQAPAFLALTFALYQVWPVMRVLSTGQYHAVTADLRSSHQCMDNLTNLQQLSED